MISGFRDPFEALFAMQKALESRLASDWMGGRTAGTGTYPPINAFQSGDGFVAVIELPGIDKNDIEIEAKDKAERLLRNLAQRLERDWSGVAGSILEGIDEILTITRLGLPKELRRSLACTNIIENVMSTVRRVCRNVKRWRSASMAMRWTAAAMQEAARGFRRLKAHKQLPALRAALEAHHNKNSHGVLARQAIAA